MIKKSLAGISVIVIGLCMSVPVALSETVVVATEASFPPFSRTDADGSFSGFEIDLGNEVCKRAELDCQWVKQDFDGMIAGLLARKFGLIFSSMTIKPEREKVADFSVPYYLGPSAFYAKKGTVKDLDQEIKGKRIGAYAGSTQAQYLEKKYGGDIEVVGYENADQFNADLVNGRISLAFADQLIAAEFIATPQGSDFELVGQPINDPIVTGRGVGAMFRKGDPLKAKVDQALRDIYGDGTFDRLQQKWLPAGVNIRADKLW